MLRLFLCYNILKEGVNTGKIKVFSKQHKNVLEILNETGRYTPKEEIVCQNEEARLILPLYKWLSANIPDENRPSDAVFPVWLMMDEKASLIKTPDTVILEMEIEEDLITRLNVIKWSMMNNFSYIPKDDKDLKHHKKILEDYGTNDVKAYMTPFYPEIKREIEESWKRVFDESINMGSDYSYGLVWEIKKEFIKNIR